jgi:hypothetical protein
MKAEVHVSRFPTHRVAQGTIRLPINQHIQKQQGAVFLNVHSKFNVLMDTVQEK